MKTTKYISLVLILLIISASCGVQPSIGDVPKSPTVESPSSVPAEQATVSPVVSDTAYRFYDESVKETVEDYFDKSADKLTAEEFEAISKWNYLVVEGFVESLKDIQELIPVIKYLNVSSAGAFSKEDLDVLAGMKSLKALSLYTDPIYELSFADNLPYLEIQYNTSDYEAEKNNLGAFSVLGQSFIDENMNRPIKKYVRIINGSQIFEMVCSDYYEGEEYSYNGEQERKIFFSEKTDNAIAFRSILECTGDVGDAISNKLYLADVNFDGKTDILTDNGHFGNQGFVTFTCFVNITGEYSELGSFSDIVNPSVDPANKKLLSTWRNWAASHSWAMYSFDGTQYVMTDRLTEEAVSSQQDASSDKEIWEYKIERQTDGEMQIIESFTTDDYTDNQIGEMIFDKDSFWGLLSDKWNTLFNTGKMSDFSIYGGSSINSTILSIIDQAVD